MVIAHNMLAMNTSRQLKINSKSKAESTEKLSSGYKINRSADDAAGLSISEKMRRQIRGLNQGAFNIQDGISLVQTADGALAEVADILQRVRELSIKSYNETNSDSDIEKMQQEVDNILIEIDRIGDTTTFNEHHIFSDRDVREASLVNRHTEEVLSEPFYRAVPDWLTSRSDSRMEIHPAYTQSQERGNAEIMYQYADIDNDGQRDRIYYGADQGTLNGHTWAGEWSDTIADNPSCRLDFSGLYAVTDAQGLYDNLEQLIGSEIAFPCGTCTDFMPGVFYWGEIDGLALLTDLSATQYDTLNLSETAFTYGQDANGNNIVYRGYFSAVEALADDHRTSGKTDAVKQQEVRDLGEAIAKDLRDKTFDLLDEGIRDLDHFDRVVRGNDDTSLIVYDYRDRGLTSSGAAEADLVVSGSAAAYKSSFDSVEVTGTISSRKKIAIFAGVDAKSENKIPISLPVISLKQMNLNGYQVGNQYYEETYWEYVGEDGTVQTIGSDYERQMAEYERDMEQYEREMRQYERDMVQYERDMIDYRNECADINNRYDAEYDAWKTANTTEYTQQIPIMMPVYGDYYEDGEEKHGVIGSSPQMMDMTTIVVNPGAPPEPTRDPLPTPPTPPTPPTRPVPPTRSVQSRAAGRASGSSSGGSGWVLKTRKVRREDVLDPVDKALAYVSSCRAVLGAQQNRLEHAYNNNVNTSENTQAAESQIRDTDMAREMVGYSRSSILDQGIQSMLAQANQSNQGVLSLLS